MKFKNFEIQILQMTSDVESTKAKVVDLDEYYRKSIHRWHLN